MINREKVIKGLECCGGTGMCFHGCPYHEVSQSVEGCTSQLAADALELLKEQEAVAPKIISGPHKVFTFGLCRECGTVVKLGDKYCSGCGRRLLWDDEEGDS